MIRSTSFFILISFFLLLLSSCKNETAYIQYFESPTGKYSLNYEVNTKSRKNHDYGIVKIKLLSGNNTFETIDTRVSDFSKWALGWTMAGDTIVLQSSDIGNKAWVIINDKAKQINVNKYLNKRARELYNRKYASQ